MATDVSLAFAGYVLAYGLATLGCGVALVRAVGVKDGATRRGLVGLLVGSGGWAALELAFLVAPTPDVKYLAYSLSLVVGLTTVGAWLYFCSAYTGRSFHRNPTYRRAAVAAYAVIVAVKLTNPLHGLYFSTEFATTPFPHLTIEHEVVHWVVTGLSYALASIGFFMLYELFLEADYDTRPLGALVGVTGLPVVLDIFGFATDLVLDINYEPLGVALFAVGVLFVFEQRFLAVQLTGRVDEAVVYLDDGGRIREVNRRARSLFPELAGATGEPFEEVLPDAAARLDATDEETILARDGDDGTRYYAVSDTSFSVGQASVGRLVLFTDVTATERRRRELERQNEQLEGFAGAVRHELLNALQIVEMYVDAAGDALDEGDVTTAGESLETVSEAAARMERTVNDLASMARYGRTLEATRPVELAEVAEAAFDAVVTGDLELSVRDEGTVEADPTRLRGLFENAFRFARHNGASTVAVGLTDDGFAIEDDGDPPGDRDPEAFFAYSGAVPTAEAGMSLPNVRLLARVHGWTVDIDTDYAPGVRVVVSGAAVTRVRSAPA